MQSPTGKAGALLPNVGIAEILILVLVALVVFGPARLPEMMRSAGKAFRTFQSESQKAMADLREAVDISDVDKEIADAVIFDTPDDIAIANEQKAEAAAKKKSTTPKKKPATKKTVTKKTAAKKTTATAAKKKAATPSKPAETRPIDVTVVDVGYPSTEDT